jgi:hypothetical protein
MKRSIVTSKKSGYLDIFERGIDGSISDISINHLFLDFWGILWIRQ